MVAVERSLILLSSLFWLYFQVKAFCDVDENKIQKGFYTYEDSEVRSTTVDAQYNRLILILYKSMSVHPTTLF